MSPQQTSDVVVLLPGITGSVLARRGKEVWGTSARALLAALVSGGRDIRDLAVANDDPALDDLGDGVTATRLVRDLTIVPGFWKIDGYSKVARTLSTTFRLTTGRNFFEFPYDWRRDNRVSARKLARAAHEWLRAWRQTSGNTAAKLVLVAHSMGGLVARYFLEALGGWRDARSLITFGTPYRGSLNALNYLAHGYTKALGPVKLDLSPLLHSLTSVYQLLPIYECVEMGGRLVRVGEAAGIPGVDAGRARQALAFHHEIRDAQAANAKDETYAREGYRTYPIVGIDQPTLQSARVAGNDIEMLPTLAGEDVGGDGTVPRVSATPFELSEERREMFVAEAHGSLQNFDPALTHVEGVVSGDRIDLERFREALRPAVITLRLAVDDAFHAGEPVRVRARPSSGAPVLTATVADAVTGEAVRRGRLRRSRGRWQAVELAPLPAGLYRVTVGGSGPASAAPVSPVTDVFAVAGAPPRPHRRATTETA